MYTKFLICANSHWVHARLPDNATLFTVHVSRVFLGPSVLHVTVCAFAEECWCLIFMQPTFPSGMNTGPTDTQSNRFCNLSAQRDHKHESLLNLNSSDCPMATIVTVKVAWTLIDCESKRESRRVTVWVQKLHLFFEHFIFYHQSLLAFMSSSKSCLLCSLCVTFCELPSHQFLCQTHFPFMRDFGKGV